jgi:hypothetical protein
MNIKTTKNLFYTAAFLAGLYSVSYGNLLTLNTFQAFGSGGFTISGATESGATVNYGADVGRNDVGLAAVINTSSLTPFTQVGDTLNYSFSLGSISAANNLSTPVYRVGFDFGSTASLRYETSVGTQPNLRFGSNTDGNPFASGTTTSNEGDWSPYDFRALRFDEGNEINATVSLELVAFGASTYDYKLSVTYTNGSVSNSKSYTFTGVNGDQVVSLFHATNSSGLIDGDTYTISNASLEFAAAVPEPSTVAAIGGVLVFTVVLLRRRMRAR